MTPPIKRPLLLHGPPPPLPLSVDSMEGVSRMLLFILSFALVHHLFALIRLFPWSLVGVCVPRVACTYDGWGRNEDAVAFDARAHTQTHTHDGQKRGGSGVEAGNAVDLLKLAPSHACFAQAEVRL